MKTSRAIRGAVICLLLGAGIPAPPDVLAVSRADPKPGSLAELPLEDLLNVEVTSVARQEQSLSESAAAVFVITQDDIRRSAATSIPELLRMVPGLDVAQITANTWAITARGFNGQFANKMLVLMDGRTLYTPLFSGVFWDTQDTVLGDLDRIEVIRGPGASVWGTNAVNGVINIITKSARETQGGSLHLIAGTEDRGIVSLRHGGALKHGGAYRAYVKSFTRDAFERETGGEAADDWHALRTGFRMDTTLAGGDSLTIQGDAYRGRTGNTITALSLSPPYESPEDIREDVSGANVLGRWVRTTSSKSGVSVQVYADTYDRQSDLFRERRETYDADLQHHFALGTAHRFLWGLQVRRSEDRTHDTFISSFTPDRRADHFFSAFVEDLVNPSDSRWHLTLGSKFEYNDYIGFEVEPSVRLLARLGERSSAWAAVSRALRSPSRADRDARANLQAFPTLGPPALVSVLGNPDQREEETLAYELGYRAQWSESVSFDAAAFYNEYDGLRTAQSEPSFPEANPPPAHLVFPLRFANRADGHSYGAEVACNWRVTDHWKLSGWYAWLRVAIDPDASSNGTAASEDADVPRHVAYLRSSLELPRSFNLETSLQFVDELRKQDVPSYLRADLRLGWRPTARIEASVGIRNALDRVHREARPQSSVFEPTLIERSYDARLSWKF
jgi:iron complex outermembrane receptor protein